VSE
jgi:hypothetical protein